MSTQSVFQCYGPEHPDPAATAGKIQRDFDGAKKHFDGRIKRWIFVYNQRELPASSGKLLGDLRQQNPGIQINAWLRDDLHSFALKLSSESRAILFPGLRSDEKISDATLNAMSAFVRKHTILGADSLLSTHTNELTLDQTLEALSAEDKSIRVRILGYSQWLDPLPIARGLLLLTNKGYSEAAIDQNLRRLVAEGLIRMTRSHILPINKRICNEAANSLADEFIGMLTGD